MEAACRGGAGGGAHSRQPSTLSSLSSSSFVFSDLSCGSPAARHARQLSQLSASSWTSSCDQAGGADNRGYCVSPRPAPRHGRQRHHGLHSRQSSAASAGLHSRQLSDSSDLGPGRELDSVPGMLRLHGGAAAAKCSPVSQLSSGGGDLGYHTMLAQSASSPDTSPSASMDLSSLSLASCPRGVTRPRPPAVPGSCGVQLDPASCHAHYQPQQPPRPRDQLARLSDQLVARILGSCDAVSRVRAGQASRRLHGLAWSPGLWTHLALSGLDTADTDTAVRCILARLSRGDPRGAASSVTRVSLTACARLSDAGLGCVSRLCPGLARLELRSCKMVTNTGLADIVTRCARLAHLDITGCSLVSGLEPSSRGELRERLSLGLGLRHLDLTDVTRLDDLSLRLILQASGACMEFLYLRRCANITDTGIKMVAAYCFALRELSISDCPAVTDTALTELARLGPRLRYLSAAKCVNITDRGVIAVARHCYKLRYLNVRGCEAVSDTALEVLARNCAKLRSLDIGKCDVTDAGLRVVAERLPSLRKLSLRGCEMISDAGVAAVAAHCRGLAQLNLQEVGGVSLATYRAVKKSCTRCIIEHSNPGFH